MITLAYVYLLVDGIVQAWDSGPIITCVKKNNNVIHTERMTHQNIWNCSVTKLKLLFDYCDDGIKKGMGKNTVKWK